LSDILKILLIFDSPYFRERGYNFKEEFSDPDWKAEGAVYNALLKSGYQVSLLGLYNDIGILLEEVRKNRPDVIFNLVEVFNQKSHLDGNIVAVLELLGIPYTGASAATLFICGDKALSKKILSAHQIRVPNFYTLHRNQRVYVSQGLKFPLVVKPLSEQASRGISRASMVDNEEALTERVRFIHENIEKDAIVEEYIDGREFYVSVLSDKKTKVLPLREMKFGQLPEDEPRIATYKAKWDNEYRRKWGIRNVFAGKLAKGLSERIGEACKRAYEALNMDSYARFDMRLTNDAKIYILEVNANPSLAPDDELAQSAERGGISYGQLVRKIILLAFNKIKK
jgi:D-alanine-D-alanine ligase